MKKYLICKDGKQTLTEECLKECRLKDRCSPRSYLKLSGQAREWNNIPSVTQLIQGIRESYLMIKNDYAESPEGNTFSIAGTKSHAALEKFGIDPEKGITYEGISGIPDEIDEDVLIDYKFIGSFKVAKVLGIRMEEKETGEYFKNGKPKVKKVPVFGERDFAEYGKQINMYRLMVEQTGIKIKQQKLFMVPRDGNLWVAYNRGVYDPMYYLDVPFIDDQELKTWFLSRRDQLLNAVADNELPPRCSDEECWNGSKCKGKTTPKGKHIPYCQMTEFCTGNPYLEGE
jgi:hypothetical protein